MKAGAKGSYKRPGRMSLWLGPKSPRNEHAGYKGQCGSSWRELCSLQSACTVGIP